MHDVGGLRDSPRLTSSRLGVGIFASVFSFFSGGRQPCSLRYERFFIIASYTGVSVINDSFYCFGTASFFYNSKLLFLQGILSLMIEIHCVVTGHVQGVAYRTYVQESAMELELVGYVKNLSDGSVKVVAQGAPDTLKDFVEYLHEGSLMSVVEGVAVEWRSADKTYTEFSLLH